MYQDYSDSAQYANSESLRNFLIIIFKRKWLIFSIFVLVVTSVTLASFFMPSVFRASSKILLEREIDSEKALLFRLNIPTGYENYDWINTEIETIKSYPVALQVVQSLQLDEKSQEYKNISNVDKSILVDRVVIEFQKELKVENAKNSNVISVSYEANDPKIAAATVNRVINTYMNYRAKLYDESETYKFFEEQMRIADRNLQELEKRQAEFKQQKEVISPEEQREILLTRLAEYERSLTVVRTKRISKEAKLAIIKDHLAEGKELSIPSTETSDSPSREKHIAKLKGQQLDLEIRREQLLQKFTPEYTEVVALEKQIAAMQKKIEDEIRQIVDMEESSIRALKAEEEVLQAAIERITDEIKEFAQKEYEFFQLSRGIDDNREIYSMLLKQREEARISHAKMERGVKIKVISPAMVPTDPVKPRKKMNILLGILLGFASALGLALLTEYFDHSIDTPSRLEKLAGLNVLGSVQEVSIGSLGGGRREEQEPGNKDIAERRNIIANVHKHLGTSRKRIVLPLQEAFCNSN